MLRKGEDPVSRHAKTSRQIAPHVTLLHWKLYIATIYSRSSLILYNRCVMQRNWRNIEVYEKCIVVVG